MNQHLINGKFHTVRKKSAFQILLNFHFSLALSLYSQMAKISWSWRESAPFGQGMCSPILHSLHHLLFYPNFNVCVYRHLSLHSRFLIVHRCFLESVSLSKNGNQKTNRIIFFNKNQKFTWKRQGQGYSRQLSTTIWRIHPPGNKDIVIKTVWYQHMENKQSIEYNPGILR